MRIAKHNARLKVDYDDPATGRVSERPVIIRAGNAFDMFLAIDEAERVRDELIAALAVYGR
ncbi:MAG: hypothetical protein WAW17_27945 [Rhodococcus sp. (in: high G+C Gram-positive bacteria)]|uniref:hypothetical protein n=1 Tax=Rhodococcus sp. TaxID=1831 RepID=UPI003BAE85F1